VRCVAGPRASAATATTTAIAASMMTNVAGGVCHDASARPRTKSWPPESGHGTRAAHAAAAHTASAAATPSAGRAACRLQTTKKKPSAIAAAHCVPAPRVSARIASFLRALSSELRASAKSAAVAAIASPPLAHDAPRGIGGSSAVAASAAVAARPSIAAASSSTALARVRSTSAAGASARAGRAANDDSIQRAAQRSGAGPAPAPCVSWKRSTKGATSDSIAAIASARSRTAASPSRSSLASDRARSSAARSGRANASVARPIATASGTGIASSLRVGAAVRRPPQSALATSVAASAATASHVAGSTGSGRPTTAMPRSRKRWSRPGSSGAMRAKRGTSQAIAAATSASSTSAGTRRASRARNGAGDGRAAALADMAPMLGRARRQSGAGSASPRSAPRRTVSPGENDGA
jgi:hypothetical protein